MKNNNGKIVIAIVAMFAIAVAVIGFTYAYFVASVTGNTNTNSVNVTAGILEVEYTSEEANRINVDNIVPGWSSDSDSYYDPVASVYTVDESKGIKGIKAVLSSANTFADGSALENAKSIETPTEANGIQGPATFTVANTGDDTAYYAIKLVDIVNGLETTDQKNFTLSLTNKSTTSDTEVTSVALNASGEQMLVTGPITLAKGAEYDYEIMLNYANVPDAAQNSTGKTITAKIEIVGISQQLNAQGEPTDTWVDADGNVVTFATAA